MQMLYQITGAYFQDDHADSLRNDPVLNAVIGKAALASQPTLSRFHNRMDEQSLQQLEEIQRILRRTESTAVGRDTADSPQKSLFRREAGARSV